MAYPEDWNVRRKLVYERDDHTCQKCGETDAELHAHHKVPKSKGGSDAMSNLVTLCKDCHESVHGHPIPTGPPAAGSSGGLSVGRVLVVWPLKLLAWVFLWPILLPWKLWKWTLDSAGAVDRKRRGRA